MATSFRCPVCDRRFTEEQSDAAMPFCSLRCKKIDAVRWLDEKYSIPDPEDESEDEPEGEPEE